MRQYLRCRGDDGIWALGTSAGPSYNHTTSADDQCLLLQQAAVYQDCGAFNWLPQRLCDIEVHSLIQARCNDSA